MERTAAGAGHQPNQHPRGAEAGSVTTPAPAAAADDRRAYVLSFPAPAKAWSTNERIHWSRRSALTAAWRQAACLHATKARRHRDPARRLPAPLQGRWQVHMVIPFTRGGRRDPMNWVGTCLKSAVDGLTDAGLWPDDTPEHVQITEPRLVVDKSLTVHIHLRPIGADL